MHVELCNNAIDNESMWRWQKLQTEMRSDHFTLLLTLVFLVFNVRLSRRNASTRHSFWSKLKIFTCQVLIICEFHDKFVFFFNAFIQSVCFTPHYSNE